MRTRVIVCAAKTYVTTSCQDTARQVWLTPPVKYPGLTPFPRNVRCLVILLSISVFDLLYCVKYDGSVAKLPHDNDSIQRESLLICLQVHITSMPRTCYTLYPTIQVIVCSLISITDRSPVFVKSAVESPPRETRNLLEFQTTIYTMYHGWLGSRVVNVLDSGEEGPGFKSQPRRRRVTVL